MIFQSSSACPAVGSIVQQMIQATPQKASDFKSGPSNESQRLKVICAD